MRELSHPHVIKLHYIYESANYVHMILEYLRGGELFEQIKKKKKFKEKECREIAKLFLETIDYVHSLNIIHRDLKPENIFFSNHLTFNTSHYKRSNDDYSTFKVVDFGLATIIHPPELVFTKCGSPGFVAPEILKKVGYGTQADIFSIGVIIFIL